MPPRRLTRRGGQTSASAPTTPVAVEQRHDAELEELRLRTKVLESALITERKKEASRKRKHSRVSSSDESSSSLSESETDSDSSSSASSSDNGRRNKRKSKRRVKKITSSRASVARRWRNPSYERQYSTNAAVLKEVRKAKHQLSKRKEKERKARRHLQKGEMLLRDRQEWLVVADVHGHEAASKFAEGGVNA